MTEVSPDLPVVVEFFARPERVVNARRARAEQAPTAHIMVHWLPIVGADSGGE